MDEMREWFRVMERDDITVVDGHFICRTQEDVDLTIRKLNILKQALEPRPTSEPVAGGADVEGCLATP